MDSTTVTFGEKLKDLRAERHVSQTALAGRLRMDKGYLSRIENSVPNHLPSSDSIVRMAQALELSQEESDELFLAAGKLPPDVITLILNNPHLVSYLRTAARKK